MKNKFLLSILVLITLLCLFTTVKGATLELNNTFNLNSASQQGVGTDGNYIYTCFWKENGKFAKYELDGTFIEEFTIANITENLRDLTYDGTYFYAGGAGGTLYKLDMKNKSLVESIATEVSVIRHCTYDPKNDVFWVGNWYNLYSINKEGKIVFTSKAYIPCVYSSAYDNVSPGGPYLWLFTQESESAVYRKYKIDTDTVGEKEFDVVEEVTQATGIAGGSFTGNYGNKYVLIANVQQDPNLVVIYNLANLYNITKVEKENGSFEIGEAKSHENEKITIKTTPNEGYNVKAVTVNDGEIDVTKVDDTTYTFIMPGKDVSVSVEFSSKYVEKTIENATKETKVTATALLTENAVLVVTPIKSGNEGYNSLIKLVGTNEAVLGAYNITIEGGEYKGAIKLTFTISEEYNGKEITIYHKLASGTIDTMKKTVKNGKIEITVSELSPFMIVGEKLKDETPKTGNIENYILIAFSLTIMASSSLIVLKKRVF